MRSNPYGYEIKDGVVKINEEEAEIIRNIFNNYLAGMGLVECAKSQGLKLNHSSVGRLLRNKRYIGDGYYPAIIQKEIFEKAEEMRLDRAESLGRIGKVSKGKRFIIPEKFSMKKCDKVPLSPYKKVEYLYSLIEIEV